MKQYIMGMITGASLLACAFMFMGTQNKNLGDIIARTIRITGDGKLGETIIAGGDIIAKTIRITGDGKLGETILAGGGVGIMNKDGKSVVILTATEKGVGNLKTYNTNGEVTAYLGTNMDNDGIIILEVPDLDSLISTCGFDTIYHEHRQYFSINSIKKIFIKNNYTLLSFEKINYMSGSLRIFAKKNIKNKILKTETIYQKRKHLNNFIKFQKKIFLIKAEILNFINKYKKANKTIIGIAAATKGNTLLNFCGINYKDLKCIIESSPYKINKFTPGSAIPIINEKIIKKYDAAIILPWNITKHLYQKFLHKRKISYTSVAKIVKKLK